MEIYYKGNIVDDEKSNSKSKLSEKNIVVFGDSIMAGDATNPAKYKYNSSISERYDTLMDYTKNGAYPIARYIHDAVNDCHVYNYANGGATIYERPDYTGNYPTYTDKYGNVKNNFIINQVEQYVEDMNANLVPKPDYVIFNGGTNDTMTTMNIGDLTTGFGDYEQFLGNPEFDRTKTVGAMEHLLKTMLKKFRTAKFLYVAPPYNGNRSLNMAQEFANTFENIVKVCEKWGIHHFDTWKEVNCQFVYPVSEEADEYNVGLHPLAPYNKIIWGPRVLGILETL